MAKRNTFREDEELEEQINLHDILRIGVYLKPYMSHIARILAVVVMMSCIAVVVPYLTKITLVVMFVVDWRLALFSLALFPFLIAWVLILQHFQRRAYQVLSNKQSNLNAFIHESIAGVKTTQTFAQETAQFKTFQEQQNDVRTSWMKAVHIQFLMWPGIQTISVMTIAFIYYVGVTGFGAVNVSTGVLISIWLICMLSQAVLLRWSVRLAPAKPRSSTCCRVFTTLQKGR